MQRDPLSLQKALTAEGWVDEKSRDQVNAITPLARPAGAGGEAEGLTIGVRNAFGGWKRSSVLRRLMRYPRRVFR